MRALNKAIAYREAFFTRRMDNWNERPVTQAEYPQAKAFIRALRHKEDPPPQLVSPAASDLAARGYVRGMCPTNAQRFISEQSSAESAEAVKGFRLWTMNLGGIAGGIIAQVHIVVKLNDKFVDVTPPEPGDEELPFIFVPSSLLFAGTSALAIAQMMDNDLEPRLGAVCTGMVLWFKQQTCGSFIHKASVDELQIVLAPLRAKAEGISDEQLLGMGASIAAGRIIVAAPVFFEALAKTAATADGASASEE